MTVSTLALTPETTTVSGAKANTDTKIDPATTDPATIRSVTGATFVEDPDQPFHLAQQAANTAFARIVAADRDHDYQAWLAHVAPASGCTHPIRLRGTSHTVDTSTGEILDSRSTGDMPDGVLYTACGNRRATVCPSCAETYRADTYQLIKAGLVGGKGVPDTVGQHVAMFVTFTAPRSG